MHGETNEGEPRLVICVTAHDGAQASAAIWASLRGCSEQRARGWRGTAVVATRLVARQGGGASLAAAIKVAWPAARAGGSARWAWAIDGQGRTLVDGRAPPARD